MKRASGSEMQICSVGTKNVVATDFNPGIEKGQTGEVP